ncbi:hypothetical protein B0H17DRAFT_1135975 [Mycena rosella]|uniref:Uncharacterized protein n=1 Tax=Mycena rosella TaxID=1033263 RepID=A0AAD7DF23_MYCRO|nr:hypothetical protein B0H17DRAFT_1135975 [Mycena rosella]
MSAASARNRTSPVSPDARLASSNFFSTGRLDTAAANTRLSVANQSAPLLLEGPGTKGEGGRQQRGRSPHRARADVSAQCLQRAAVVPEHVGSGEKGVAHAQGGGSKLRPPNPSPDRRIHGKPKARNERMARAEMREERGSGFEVRRGGSEVKREEFGREAEQQRRAGAVERRVVVRGRRGEAPGRRASGEESRGTHENLFGAACRASSNRAARFDEILKQSIAAAHLSWSRPSGHSA